MRLLILGGSGMLGHALWRACRDGRDGFDAWTTLRAVSAHAVDLFRDERAIVGVDALDLDAVTAVVHRVQPQAIVNCVGLVKQHPLSNDDERMIGLNTTLPRHLAALAGAMGCRLVHVSTDCVFSGRRGRYREEDPTDAEDLYGRSKADGEVSGEGVATIRLSLIGRELESNRGLLEWFLSQRGRRVQGYTRAFFSGVTTHAAAEALVTAVTRPMPLSGLFHLAADRISKYDLLVLLNDAFATRTTIEASADLVIDRSLDGTRFHDATGWRAPSWPRMVAEMAADAFPYESIRAASPPDPA